MAVTNQDNHASEPSGEILDSLRRQLSRKDATVSGFGIEIHCRMASFCKPVKAASASLDTKGFMSKRDVDNSMQSKWAMSCMRGRVMEFSVWCTDSHVSRP